MPVGYILEGSTLIVMFYFPFGERGIGSSWLPKIMDLGLWPTSLMAGDRS